MDKVREPEPPAEERDPDQAWFWTDEWQEGEREAQADIDAGRLSAPFNSVDELFRYLKRATPDK